VTGHDIVSNVKQSGVPPPIEEWATETNHKDAVKIDLGTGVVAHMLLI
jgi:hypothetical protein